MAVAHVEELLSFDSTTKVFVDEANRRVTALGPIMLSVTRGEFVTIIGPSGCGKSTLLRLAAGLEHPTAGRVLYRGRPIEAPDRRRGFVFQTYNAFPWLTVAENIAFGLGSHSASERKSEVGKWLEWTGLSEFADRYPKVLSGGMRQRLALARAMVVKPELLLLDEPFGALDEATRQEMQALLLQMVAHAHCTVLLVTHDIRESVLLGDRVILLGPRPGRILETFLPLLPIPRRREQMKDPTFLSLYETILSRFPMQG